MANLPSNPFDEVNHRPQFRQAVKYKPNRLNPAHDYCSVCSYMETMNISPGVPMLSALVGDINNPGHRVDAIPNDIGKLVLKACEIFSSRNLAIIIDYKVIMPDHGHIIFKVMEVLPRSFKWYIGQFKQICTKLFWEKMPQYREMNVPMFVRAQENTKILYSKPQMYRWRFYIADNPRRALERRVHRDLFQRGTAVDKKGKGWAFYGNKALLFYPERVVVRYTRRRTEVENRNYLEWCRLMADEGAVLVSPFIHPEEQKIYKEGIDKGWRIIRIVENAFRQREHPHKREFNYCANGKLLLLALNAEPVVFARIGALPRDVCMRMNALAEEVAETEFC